jgi:ketosteroid isomerase-like protein
MTHAQNDRGEQIARRFVERIIAHDVERLLGLMTSDHVLIDSLGQSIRGKEALRTAWRTYFDWMPDYSIEIESVVACGDAVALFGRACGTYDPDGCLRDENRWEVFAAWRAQIRDHRVAEWRVYADNKRVYDILSARPPLR